METDGARWLLIDWAEMYRIASEGQCMVYQTCCIVSKPDKSSWIRFEDERLSTSDGATRGGPRRSRGRCIRTTAWLAYRVLESDSLCIIFAFFCQACAHSACWSALSPFCFWPNQISGSSHKSGCPQRTAAARLRSARGRRYPVAVGRASRGHSGWLSRRYLR